MARSPKYRPLGDYLRLRDSATITMTFEEIERILGASLPPSARNHGAFWANSGQTHVWATEWMSAGWRVVGHSLDEQRVTFARLR